jgi:hypothetical protein
MTTAASQRHVTGFNSIFEVAACWWCIWQLQVGLQAQPDKPVLARALISKQQLELMATAATSFKNAAVQSVSADYTQVQGTAVKACG